MGVTVREKKPKSGEFWVFVYHAGHRRSLKVGGEGLAQEVAQKIRKELAVGNFVVPKKVPTLKQYTKTFLSTYARHRLAPSTTYNYKKTMDKHVLPCIGSRPLDKITRSDIKTLLYRLQDRKFKMNSILSIKRTLSSVLAQAVDDDLIKANPVAGTARAIRDAPDPDGGNGDVKVFTWEEKTRLELAMEADHPRFYPLILTMLRTGIRPGEMVALKPKDIDFGSGTIAVKRTYSTITGVGPTKSGKARTVDMSPQLAKVLKEHLIERKRQALKFGLGQPPEWLFFNMYGRIHNAALLNRFFRKWLEQAKLPQASLHSLRHTYASLRLAKGDTLADVSGQLGHSNVHVTANVYCHWMPGVAKGQVAELDAAEAPVNVRTYANPGEPEAVNH